MTADQFISQLERSGGPLEQKDVVRALVEAAMQAERMPMLLDAAFQSKFIVKTQNVMRRIGPSGEGYEKLSAEFQSATEMLAAHVRGLQEGLSPEFRVRWEEDFLALAPESFKRLLSLANDLTRIKNWEIDGNPVPGVAANKKTMRPVPSERYASDGLDKRIPVILLLVWIAFLLLEPPVTTLGVVTALLLTVVSLVNVVLARSSLSSSHNTKLKGLP